MQRIFEQIDECVRLAQIKPKDIQLVILTGGSTEIPLIQQCISEYFPNAELSQKDKFSSVGMGLAFDSIRKFSQTSSNSLNVDIMKTGKKDSMMNL